MGYTHRWHMERNLGFVATFLHLFFIFLDNFEKWRKVRQHEENKKETCMGSEGFEALRPLTRKYSKTHA